MMENEQWPVKYQQSVATGLERKGDSLNNGNTEITGDGQSLQNTGIKDEPENSYNGTEEIKLETNPANVTISEKSKQTIRTILEQIKSLSQIEKFLLYLKLPAEISNPVDPFRQPLNPLGSRSEISRTICWIQTHLVEDPDISLPKQEVYNEYYQFCEKNNIKPLSQADFGKVMKQVYPKVRARRLGTRGNSRYCYSGLRRCINLKPPLLPDLSDKPLSTEAPFTQSSVASAAWSIIKEWSQQQLGVQFLSLQALAYYLILNHSIGAGTDAATKLTSAAESQSKSDEANTKNGSKHREMQLQLQRKIQLKNEGKERKRKMQSVKAESKPGSKKSRSQSVPAASTSTSPTTVQLASSAAVTSSSECSTASSTSTSPTQGKTICDKSDCTQLAALPDFKSFQKPVTDGLCTGGGQETSTGAPLTNKVAIPRLHTGAPTKTARKLKYKMIQPRLQPCDIATYNPSRPSQAGADNRSQDVPNIDRIKEKICSDDDCDVPEDFPLTRERLNSISNVEKDAMDEYLGTNNSQHEEELSKYFSNNDGSSTTDGENTTKLSTLRQLLEQNGISDNKSAIENILNNTPALPDNIITISDPATMVSQTTDQGAGVYINPVQAITLPRISSNARRRVSFETPAADDPVPPSPNTRRKNFSFTPISPGPQSPNSAQSKCSSTNASPFVSPRNTPVPRIKNTTHQNAGIMLVQDGRKSVKIKKEPELSLEIPSEAPVKNYMPMSAPVSPMLNNKSVLQKLLNANSKVQYRPGYTNSQSLSQVETSQEPNQFFPENSLDITCRSRSVPLHQMNSFQIESTFITNIPRDPEFTEADPIVESDSDNVKLILNSLDESPCDNNNIDMFNLDLSSNNQCLPEFGLNLINNTAEIPADFPPNEIHFSNQRSMIRSQSIDISVSFETDKCNPSRSVPSTPLPFAQGLKIQPVKDFNNQSSRSYPSTPLNSEETFTYNVNGDCLLNGQPIRTDDIEFIPNFDMNGDNNINQSKGFQLEGDFGIIENGDTLMDESCILMNQNYNGNIN